MFKFKAGGPGIPGGDGGDRGNDGVKTCYCSCAYEGGGGSNMHDNCRANYYIGSEGMHSPGDSSTYKC